MSLETVERLLRGPPGASVVWTRRNRWRMDRTRISGVGAPSEADRQLGLDPEFLQVQKWSVTTKERGLVRVLGGARQGVITGTSHTCRTLDSQTPAAPGGGRWLAADSPHSRL
ncbi:hypothetical protein ATANTOWER_018781 [Ataeniobius toweri]|uniref:Uncharacterized protein n=1 Tax=Ataeniobius toweri TaxID=208326 RepID=A0ABU7BGD3_9TELE|nr:hypothetical protein [Ataeniobius toweri]